MALYEMDSDSLSDFLDGPEEPDEMATAKAMAMTLTLDKMFNTSGHFSICDVDKLLKMNNSGITAEQRQAYNVLNSLHCAHYDRMTADQIREIKKMTLFVLGVKVIDSGAKIRPPSASANIDTMRVSVDVPIGGSKSSRSGGLMLTLVNSIRRKKE